MTTTPALVRLVRERGLALVSMQAAPVTLGDVFRTLTRESEEPRSVASEKGRRP